MLLAVLAERRPRPGGAADHRGGRAADRPVSPRASRRELAAALNALLASPSAAAWREGTSLDVGACLTPTDGRPPAVVVSVAHLDDDDRAPVLGVVLDEVLAWARGLPGSATLRALVVFDEVYGFLPPHPANPPTKRPLVALLEQGRAYGVGVVLASQNPMDLDYLWFVGRLQTDARASSTAWRARRRAGPGPRVRRCRRRSRSSPAAGS